MLGERLLAAGVITAAQLEAALEAQRSGGGLIGEVLLKLAFLTEEGLSRALAAEARVPFMSINGMRPDPSAIALVPEPFARRHGIAPLGFRDAVLEVLQANPFDVVAVDELERLAGHPAQIACGTHSDVLRLIERSYGERHRIDGLVKEGLTLELLLNDAIERGATVLHVEPEDRTVRLRYRVDGVLMRGGTLPIELHPAFVSRVKVMAGLDVTGQHRPQEGRFSHEIGGRRIDLHVSSVPTVSGETIAIRILAKEKLIRGIEELGFSRRNLAMFRDVLSKSRGLVLVAGPTGAGKTTTVYSALADLSGRETNIMTVEDPVEHRLPSIRQTPVRPQVGLTFAAAVRSLLQQDPDVIMVSEMGDVETAELALRAALSGVLVFSTAHAADSADAVLHLMDIGLEPCLVASGVAATVAQRLVRVICPQCSAPATYPAETLAKVGLSPDPDLALSRGRGCPRCHGTGYAGRTGVFEILTMDATIRALIRERAGSQRVKTAAVQAGMKTLMEDALAKAIFGRTTVEEVLRVTDE